MADFPHAGGMLDLYPEPPKLAIMYAAALKSQVNAEVPIDGVPRGAPSYAFARALGGGADMNSDGNTSRIELQAYISNTVHFHAKGRQTPVRLPGEPAKGAETVLSTHDLPEPVVTR